MAVQDDNTILKKADLKAYHEQIAGQLGGTFALRTNNGDYYSTDEKVVGVWTDGKPIYQKTVQIPVSAFVDATPNSAGYCIPTVPHNISNIGVVVNLFGQAYGNIVRPIPFSYGANAPDFKYFASLGANDISVFIECGTDFRQSTITANTYGAYATLQYTKTTDQPNSAITSGAYDITFPNTWPANTEIYLSNGVYGYRATGTISGYNREGRIDVQLGYSGRPQLVNTGGEVSINAGTDDNTIQWNGGYYWSNTDYITCSAVGISGGILRFQLTDPNSRPHRVDAWVTYLKGGN